MTDRHDYIASFNDGQAAELNSLAATQREAILITSGDIITKFLLDQAEAHAQAGPGDVIDYFVGQDLERAPDRYRAIGNKTLSFMVEGWSIEQRRQERLRILMPISPKLDIDEPRQIELIPTPKEIYTERSFFEPDSSEPVVYSRHIIDQYGIMLYALDEDDLEKQTQQPDYEQLLFSRVSTQFSLLVQLREDIVNWNNMPQIRSAVGYKEVEDL